MNRTNRRRRTKTEALEADLQATIKARDSLLDVLNALLMSQGGRVVLPAELIQASKRTNIHVTQKAEPDRYIIELEGMEPEQPQGIRDRLRRLGLKPA